MLLTPGTAAPDFTLTDQAGEEHRLSGYRGRWVLLYFYPKDDTPGCTTEACALRDAMPRYREQNCVVLGVSGDGVESHGRFAEKYALPFPLLADTTRGTIDVYGASEGKKSLRMSFLIDPQGTIRKIYRDVVPERHATEVLGDI